MITVEDGVVCGGDFTSFPNDLSIIQCNFSTLPSSISIGVGNDVDLSLHKIMILGDITGLHVNYFYWSDPMPVAFEYANDQVPGEIRLPWVNIEVVPSFFSLNDTTASLWTDATFTTPFTHYAISLDINSREIVIFNDDYTI